MRKPEFRLPAEWEPQAGILIAWPHGDTDWSARLADVESTYVALATAVARFESLLIIVASESLRDRAARLLVAAGADAGRINYVVVEYDDTWLRDSGPITLHDGISFRLTDFRFTGWGGKFEASRDDRLVAGLVAQRIFQNAAHRRIDWALEGGAIESDGAGTILTTAKCLELRHPEQTRVQIDATLRDGLGAQRVLWLEHGYLQGDDTDAHIDTLARFAPGDAIVFQACDDPDDPHYTELLAMAAELAALRTASGAAYALHPLPWPSAIIEDGRRLAASYANYLIVNNAVLIPAYGDPADAHAAAAIAAAHPGREVVAVPCRALIWQNGSLHCVSMQLPDGVLA
ncbi:MAG: agmatine deiminase family protein [Tahibacter sp.]